MTYGLGLLTDGGLIMASDSRSNAGVDQVARVVKLSRFELAGDRVLVLLAAGNLATTQAVQQTLTQALGTGAVEDLFAQSSLFHAARCIGGVLRQVMQQDADFVRPYGDPSATFLFGGQIGQQPTCLYQIYSAGNFVAADERTPFLQIGETKYGKPILDRSFHAGLDLEVSTKLALLSFDATIRSNLSVAAPIDLVAYRAGSLALGPTFEFGAGESYYDTVTQSFSAGLTELVDRLPNPPGA
ncbi:MAG: peptidase [Pseudomonadota bacterium]